MAHAHISVESWGKNKGDSQNSPLRVQHKRKSSQPQRSYMDGDSSRYQQQESDSRTFVKAVQFKKQIAAGLPQTAAPLQEPDQQLVVPASNAPIAVKVCTTCGVQRTPMWRCVNNQIYCNACGLRLKRQLGLM